MFMVCVLVVLLRFGFVELTCLGEFAGFLLLRLGLFALFDVGFAIV